MSALNYAEEQENELQALECMYPTELEIISRECPVQFTIKLVTEDYMDNEIQLFAHLQFDLPEKYPDAFPEVQVIELSEQLDESHKQQLIANLNEEMSSLSGTVMVFSLVTSVNDWLVNQVQTIKQQIQEQKDADLRKHEEKEFKKFEGTRVTLESFMAWKANYDAETGKAATKLAKESNKKLTGRQLFERDASLANSDLAFIKEGDAVEGVAVDETLFQDLDDLDIDDEHDDDEEDDDDEYNPNEFSDYSDDGE